MPPCPVCEIKSPEGKGSINDKELDSRDRQDCVLANGGPQNGSKRLRTGQFVFLRMSAQMGTYLIRTTVEKTVP